MGFGVGVQGGARLLGALRRDGRESGAAEATTGVNLAPPRARLHQVVLSHGLVRVGVRVGAGVRVRVRVRVRAR